MAGPLSLTGSAASGSFTHPFRLTVVLGRETSVDTFTIGQGGTSGIWTDLPGGTPPRVTPPPLTLTKGTLMLGGHLGVFDLEGSAQSQTLAVHIEYTCTGVNGA